MSQNTDMNDIRQELLGIKMQIVKQKNTYLDILYKITFLNKIEMAHHNPEK